MGNKELVRKLFHLYAGNYSMFYPNISDTFVCPLCLISFGEEAIEAKQISEEHIVPRSLGGGRSTLTCTNCNNTHGSKYEAHLERRFRSEDSFFGKSDSSLRGTVKVGEGEHTADFYLSPDSAPNIRIEGLPEYSNPELSQRALNELLESVAKGGPITFDIRIPLGYNTLSSKVAFVRMAYLYMFYFFGYGYILRDEMAPIRQFISSPDPMNPILNGILRLSACPEDDVIGILMEPEELQCFFVPLILSTEIQRPYGVAMPGYGSNAADIYNRFTEAASRGIEGRQIQPVFFESNRDYLTDPALKHESSTLWQHYTGTQAAPPS